MAKFRRKKAISLAPFSADWRKSEVVVFTKSWGETQQLRKDIQKYQREIEKSDREIKKLQSQIEKEADQLVLDGLYKELDEFNSVADKLTEKMLEIQKKLIQDNFAGGKVYDDEKKTEVELVVDDIEQFDNEVITEVAQAILGASSQKK